MIGWRQGLATALVLLACALGTLSAPSRAASERGAVVSIYAPRGAGGDCTKVLPLRRLVAPPAVLKGAMQALLAGPTKAERARGYGGWFSGRTAGYLRSVRIDRGIAFVDFRSFARVVPNASSSCGGALLLAQLDRTAMQFPIVRQAVYSFDGSRRAFYEWLQRETPALRR